jgi:tetratricopeptide (TPR) repeat protein
MRNFFLLIFYLLFYCCLLAAVNEDGTTVSANDTLRVQALIDSSKKYMRSAPDRANSFVDEAFVLSEKLVYPWGIGRCFNYSGAIAYYRGNNTLALSFFNKADSVLSAVQDSAGLAIVYSNRGIVYNVIGNFNQALKDYLLAISINENQKNKVGLGANYTILGGIYFRHGHYQKAGEHFLKGYQIDSIQGDSSSMAIGLGSLGGVHLYQSDFEQANVCFERAHAITKAMGDQRGELLVLSQMGTLHEKKEQYEMARTYYLQMIDLADLLETNQFRCSAYGNVAVTFYKQKRYKEALKWAFKQMKLAEELKDSMNLKEAYYKISSFYGSLNHFDKAYEYLEAFNAIDVILRNREKELLLRNVTLNHQLLNQERELKNLSYKNEIQSLTIKNKNLKLYGTVLFFILLLLGLIIAYRLRQQKVNAKQLALQQQLLKSQMSPHFIFNVFNAIQSYVLDGKTTDAVVFLRKFAKLIRIFLEKSEFQYTTIKEEVEQMICYLEVEQMRLGKKLRFKVTVDEALDASNFRMPSFLAQTYLENAIWHGTVGVTEAKIEVCWTKEKSGVLLTITDNGMGITASRKRKSKMDLLTHQSKGMEMTDRRIQLLNRNRKKEKYRVKLLDMAENNPHQKGTRVEIELPLIQ